MRLRVLLSELILIPTLFATKVQIVSAKPAVNTIPFRKIGTAKRVFDHNIVDLLNRFSKVALPGINVFSHPRLEAPVPDIDNGQKD
jgi:hypothetical protein